MWFWSLELVGRSRIRRILAERNSLEPLVRPSERIVLARVQISSPGFWEFVGKLNPLEIIRQWLVDNHERRKDKDYREAAEAERLYLENKLLENRIIQERIEIARSMGATDQDLSPFLNKLVFDPLRELDVQQRKGLIKAVELRPEEPHR